MEENDELWFFLWDSMGYFGATLSKPVVFVVPYILESEKDGLTIGFFLVPHYRNPIQIRCAMTAMVVLL